MEKSAANSDQDASLGDSNNSENGDENDIAEDARSDDELTRPIKSEAETIEVENEIKDNVWAFDVSEEAVKARTKELPSDLKRTLVLEDGADGPSAYEQLGRWIAETAEEKGGVAEVSDIDFCKKAKEFGIESKHKTVNVLAQSILDD
jgi:translation initiation factor 5